jgi:hypothetical protein
MRFTLAKLFLAVALIALACAGMLSPTSLWTAVILSMSALLYVIVAIRAIRLDRRPQIAGLIFSLVGGGYLLLATCSIFPLFSRSLLTNYPLALIARARDVRGVPYVYTPVAPATSTYPYGGMGSLKVPASSPYPTVPANSPYLVGTVTVPSSPMNASPATIDSVIAAASLNVNTTTALTNFFLIGHCAWSWLFAVLAGWFSGWMYAKRTRSTLV